MVLIVMIIERALLLPIRRIVGMIYIEDNRRRGLGVTCKKVVDQGTGEPIEVLTVDLVL